MIHDLQKGAGPLASRRYDVAICGSGPAGITVARELAAAGKQVAVFEAGGLAYSEESQAQYDGTESGINTWNMALKATRLRYFGGTSNHWTGLCGVFEPADFWARRYHALPGWPIGRDEVLRHKPRAAEILDLPAAHNFDPIAYAPLKGGAFHRLELAQSAPTRFGAKYLAELEASDRVDVILNANLVDVRLAAATGGVPPSVDHLVVANYRQEKHIAKARRYVLALGSVENARMLLSADSQQAGGLGNASGFVGACFMEHLNVQLGRFIAKREDFVAKGNGWHFSPAEATLRQHAVGTGVISLGYASQMVDGGRLGPVRTAAKSFACQYPALLDFTRKFVDFPCVGEGVLSTMLEQAPDKRNRVTLGKERDRFGLRRPHIHWELTEADQRTVRTLALEFSKSLVAADIARVQLAAGVTDPSKKLEFWYHAHQMGTTRMSARPEDGVVDADSKVHGVANLYMAGSSVFPTGGGINPTFTIVMLALRLGQHLARATA